MIERNNIDRKRREMLQMAARYMPSILLMLFMIALFVVDYGASGVWKIAVIGVLAVLLIIVAWYPYWKKRK